MLNRALLLIPVIALLCVADVCPAQYRPKAAEVRTGVAADAFSLPEGLEAKVWAKAPQFFNPTNIDVDAFGRVWVAEAVNYRLFNNEGKHPLKHPDGDRIMVLEDADGDGVAEKSTVFIQDKDLTSPLGVAVFGNRVVVSCSPSIFIYTDVNGDGKFDPSVGKKEVFLTGFGGFDHDHGLHSVFAGPDGFWNINAGNAGEHTVTDRAGKTLRTGSWYTGGTPYNNKNTPGRKSDDGHVYVGGFAARVRPDGTGLAVFAHNFRNNYEHCFNSFGEAFQNDNDDEVMSCRTTWLMEHANSGYSSADGSRSWKADRRPGQTTPIAHWHQDDPGVNPSGDLYGAGAPTGMVVYEIQRDGPELRGGTQRGVGIPAQAGGGGIQDGAVPLLYAGKAGRPGVQVGQAGAGRPQVVPAVRRRGGAGRGDLRLRLVRPGRGRAPDGRQGRDRHHLSHRP